MVVTQPDPDGFKDKGSGGDGEADDGPWKLNGREAETDRLQSYYSRPPGGDDRPLGAACLTQGGSPL
jgi:hypothetical protein